MGADSRQPLAGQGSSAITCQVKTQKEIRRFRRSGEEVQEIRRSGSGDRFSGREQKPREILRG